MAKLVVVRASAMYVMNSWASQVRTNAGAVIAPWIEFNAA
jgi:hypothetical protein